MTHCCAVPHGHVQVDERFKARAVQKMVKKLAEFDWQLTYEGYAAALSARADEIAEGLR